MPTVEAGQKIGLFYLGCSFFCLDAKERTKEKIKTVEKMPERVLAKLKKT